MMRLIACSGDDAVVGEYTESSIYNPWEDKYIIAAIRILRICTAQEYLDFCDANELPVRHDQLKDTPHYYEIEILD